MCTTVLLRDNATNTRNLFKVTSSFVLIESASGMHFSLDYQPIEVNRRRYRKLRHRMQLRTYKDKATQIQNFVTSQA